MKIFAWLNPFENWWRRRNRSPEHSPTITPSVPPPSARLLRIVSSDGVARTLFEEYSRHRASPRGEEEIGWLLLGLRQQDQAFALAALPAGMRREAGVAHVQFNRDAQELACRILRQNDKRLEILGVVHTHPGSLRHPSEGDFQGDRLWVGQLRNGEGVFGIGTADVRGEEATGEHRQQNAELCFSWYALAQGDANYRPVPLRIESGPDLAQPLHPLWNLLETHARTLNRMCRLFARVAFEVMDEGPEKLLAVKISLGVPQQQLRLLLSEGEARYYWEKGSELIAVDPEEAQLDRAVFFILAELASEALVSRESQNLIEK